MKKADEIISTIIAIIVILLIGYALIFHLSPTMKVVCFVLCALYLIFMLVHLVLLVPLIGICLLSEEIIKDSNRYKSIREFSNIISWAFMRALQVIILFVVYGLVPVVITIPFHNSIGISDAYNVIFCQLGC